MIKKPDYSDIRKGIRSKVGPEDVGVPRLTHFIGMIIFFGLCSLYIYLAWAFVSNFLAFFLIFVLSLVFAFVFSVTEAAFSRIPSYKNEIEEYFTGKEILDYQHYEATRAAANAAEALTLAASSTRSDQRRHSSAEKRVKRVRKVLKKSQKARAIVRPEQTKKCVGALATVSVILSSFLTAFLPFAIDKEAVVPKGIGFLKGFVPEGVDHPVNSLILNLPWAHDKMFVFLLSAIPVLVLGKIIPKFLGLTYPTYFALKLIVCAKFANVMFGWLASGVTYLPQLFIRRKIKS